jgi:hypothetical protein
MKKLFVWIVDSYFMPPHMRALEEKTGLVRFENYECPGAGGADGIFHRSSVLNAEHLLVFMSSFHGDVEPAVELSKRIKAANPNARIIFRSNSEHSSDPIFEQVMTKDKRNDREEFFRIINEFIAEHGGIPTPVK